jgi:threonylcarbamoyladenosine tRNA methylthiotransferase MtaB
VVVCGCCAEADPRTVSTIPGVAAVVGNARKDEAASLAVELGLRHRGGRRAPKAEVIVGLLDRDTAVAGAVDHGDRARVRAPLKIQEGCDRRCRYCIVPAVRGPERSVPADDVVRQALVLARCGHPEIVITGIHTGRWGARRAGTTLACLLRRLLDEVDGPRFRLSSMDPDEVGDELIELLATSPRLCRHLHLSLQHLHPQVLRSMGRSGDVTSINDLIRRLAGRTCGLTLGADVLVGFPGEDDVAFDVLRSGLEAAQLAYLHVFGFSRRRGTEAWSMDGQVSPDVITRRVGLLRELSETVLRPRALEAMVGRDVDVVVERHVAGVLRGTTSEFATAELPGEPSLVRTRVLARVLRRRQSIIETELVGDGPVPGTARLTPW